ncbi:crotonase/enoyl-CoA hydratase family protein [Myxococcota bacterium]|nr:crotonase/enoyl-CoA hydratase family protein [Myxococcota bacterium]
MLTLHLEGAVAHLKLNRPDKLNALTPEVWAALPALLDEIVEGGIARAVIFSGEGRAFTAGLDLRAALAQLPIDPGGAPDGARQRRLHALIRQMQRGVTALERCPLPVIAAVHGHCVGAGVDLITACDVRLSTRDALFSVRETKLAIVADLGTLQRLPRIIGPGLARELIFTGRDFNGEIAAQIGLVNRALPDQAALMAAATALAEEIAANPPLTVQGAKAVMNEAEAAAVDRGLEYVALWNSAHLVTQDFGVAVTAQMTGQRPEFSGR